VVSHISQKTSEMWGTQASVVRKKLGFGGRKRFGLVVRRHPGSAVGKETKEKHYVARSENAV
jgi:hypothetical protein